MNTTLSVINLMPSGKEQVSSFVRTIKSEILANDKNPLPILVQLKYAERTIAEILKDDEIDDHFLKEFQLYNKDENVIVNGAELRQGETGSKYLYADSGDPVWNDLNSQIEELTKKRKEREKFLINIPYDNGVVDPETGLFITRPPKTSKTKVIVTLK